MNKEEFLEMVEMLTKVTELRRLTWNDLGSDLYDTEVNGCRISLSTYYDYNVDEAFFTLKLFNEDHKEFANYTFSEITNKDTYKLLKKLNDIIRDVLYKISESETAIMKGLKDLSKSNY